jgi:uroporphyrinogen decarboxylase
MENIAKYLGAVGESIDVVQFGDDLGMQTGPPISPRTYEEFYRPRHAALWARAKELADVKVMLHCCGGVYELMPGLIDAGLDAINPVQTTCAGMEPARLKAEFGRDVVFWGGGCDTRNVLPNGTPDEVRAHVRRMVDILAPGGSFVFQQVHNIQADVPPENVLAMFDAVHKV